jgi:hypothetical protein
VPRTLSLKRLGCDIVRFSRKLEFWFKRPEIRIKIGWYFPAGGGIWGFDSGTSIFNHGVPSQEAILKLARPIMVPVRQNFNVNAEFFVVGSTDARTVLNAGATDDEKVIN